MELREIVCEAVDRVHMAQDRIQVRNFVNTVMNYRVA